MIGRRAYLSEHQSIIGDKGIRPLQVPLDAQTSDCRRSQFPKKWKRNNWMFSSLKQLRVKRMKWAGFFFSLHIRWRPNEPNRNGWSHLFSFIQCVISRGKFKCTRHTHKNIQIMIREQQFPFYFFFFYLNIFFIFFNWKQKQSGKSRFNEWIQ